MDATRYLDWPNNLTRSELVALLRSFATEALDIEHILGQALGMPIDHDGDVGPAGMPMVGDNTALTLAMAAAKRLGELDIAARGMSVSLDATRRRLAELEDEGHGMVYNEDLD